MTYPRPSKNQLHNKTIIKTYSVRFSNIPNYHLPRLINYAGVNKYVRDSIKRENCTPSTREIGKRFGISPSGVVHHLQLIEEKGFIARQSGKSRSVKILVDPYDVNHLPIIGEVVDKKLVRFEVPKRIDLGELFNDPRCFVIVRDNDYLVVRKQRSAKRGQTVVAINQKGEFFSAEWYPEGDCIRLQPIDKRKKFLFDYQVKLLGRLVGVVQKLY